MPSAVCWTAVALLIAPSAVSVFCDTRASRPDTVCLSSVTLFTVAPVCVTTPSSFCPNSSSLDCCPLTVPLMSVICPDSRSPALLSPSTFARTSSTSDCMSLRTCSAFAPASSAFFEISSTALSIASVSTSGVCTPSLSIQFAPSSAPSPAMKSLPVEVGMRTVPVLWVFCVDAKRTAFKPSENGNDSLSGLISTCWAMIYRLKIVMRWIPGC